MNLVWKSLRHIFVISTVGMVCIQIYIYTLERLLKLGLKPLKVFALLSGYPL